MINILDKKDQEKLVEDLKKVLSSNFYGKITIILNAGNIVHMTREESIKFETKQI